MALGRAVDLMIFDEPAANLGTVARAVFIDLLAQRRAAAMLIASHRLEEVAGLVNRVIERDRGKLALDDRLRAGELRRALIDIAAPHPPLAAALAGWGFAASEGETRFAGPAAETFRFLGLLARYGGLSLVIWLALAALLDLLLLSVLIQSRFLPEFVIAIALANPLQAFRTASMILFDPQLILLGPASYTNARCA